MDQYPEELRTPPMPLVALVGMPELHSAISLSLHTEQLPLNTLAIPDISKISIIGGKEKKPVDARMPPPVGILKADWLAKHRTRSPAVLAVLLSCEQVYGDPAQWLQVFSNIDTIKGVIRGRNIKLVVAVVQPSVLGDMNEDRLTALRKRAEVDAKNCLTFVTHESELKRSLLRLGSVMGELASMYYRDEGRRVKLRIEKKAYSSLELSVRYNFKVAVYAEFRRDWVTALKFYETAYSLLQEVITAHMELQPVQRIVELKAVAEQLHFKISTLLLHSGKESEAVKWFRQHIAWYKRLVGPPEGAFLHWAWVCKQYQVFAELLDNSLVTASPVTASTPSPGPPVTDRELQPGYYLQIAASYMVLRRRCFESALATFEAFEEEGAVDVLAGPREEIGPPLYVGQAPRVLKRGSTVDLQSPTEAEFMRHVMAVEKSFAHTHATIDLLTRAHEHFKKIQAFRMIYQLGSEMGREYFNAREYEKAKRLFDSVSGMYRKEAWVSILGATLGYLRECARQLGLLQEYIEYALELASLPIPATFGPDVEHAVVSGPEVGPAGPLGQFQSEQVHREVVGLLQGSTSVLPAREGETGMAVTEEHPVALEIDLVSPLRICLSAYVAFHEQVVKPGIKTSFTLSLVTHLPLSLRILELEIHFNQPRCNVILRSNGDAVPDNLRSNKKGEPAESIPCRNDYDLELEPSKWKRFTVDILPDHSGKLECLAVVARVGPFATLRCQVEGSATQSGIFLWMYEPGLDTSPVKDSSLGYFGQKMLQVEEAEPLVSVELFASGPALVGETFPVRILVTSKGHPVRGGELDVYLGAPNPAPAATPRSTSPGSSSTGPGPAEILRAGEEGDSKPYLEFTGPLQLPSLEPDEEWATTVYMRWSEAKPVNLMAFLGYQLKENLISDEAGSPCPRLRVQKSLFLLCEEALDVSYQYVAPFRKDFLLEGGLAAEQSKTTVALPLDEASIFVVTLKNSSSLTVYVDSINVVERDAAVCSIRKSANRGDKGGVRLSPDQVFTQLFHVRPLVVSSGVNIGPIEICWRRELPVGNASASPDIPVEISQGFADPVTRLFSLDPVLVESPPLIVTFDCPPSALLGVPFMCSMNMQNTTSSLQEVSFSVFDTQSFIFSGAHSDTLSILPKSSFALSYKLVPIAAGMQQLPQVRFTSTRYDAGFQPSSLSTQLFIYPSAHVVDPQKTEQSALGNPGIPSVS
ncbi:hypothetical protein R1sor_025106 [Riccia sorocarpa]|uniref:Trafficking protein particle complex subunit 11 domain-containing protein n=1 Tax=Riccia sorocarpa TaxID=122646 RepID=A0ABD3G858_9MARC